jgi:hypothetical protein
MLPLTGFDYVWYMTSHNHPKTIAKNYKLLCLFFQMNCGCQHMDAFDYYIKGGAETIRRFKFSAMPTSV